MLTLNVFAQNTSKNVISYPPINSPEFIYYQMKSFRPSGAYHARRRNVFGAILYTNTQAMIQ